LTNFPLGQFWQPPPGTFPDCRSSWKSGNWGSLKKKSAILPALFELLIHGTSSAIEANLAHVPVRAANDMAAHRRRAAVAQPTTITHPLKSLETISLYDSCAH